MLEFQQRVLNDSFYNRLSAPFNNGTFVWGYKVDGANASYPARTIVAQRNRTTTVKWQNDLPFRPFLQKYLTVDQTLHFADPLHQMGSRQPYAGPIPTVVHLHGAEVSSRFDGSAEGWYTPNGLHGAGYDTASRTDANAAIFTYPNTQQATTLWFHDHTLGMTRTNMLSGLVGMYLIRDQFDTGAVNNPLRLPADGFEIELILQDRLFDTNGQLLFPDGSNPEVGEPPNPDIHPFWIPEYFGDVNVVNGRSWPFLNVEGRRYRFRIVNAANARFYNLKLVNSRTGADGPPIWLIGTDGGLLDRPVRLTNRGAEVQMLIAPAERQDVIIDFDGFEGQSFTLVNDANAPFPGGDPVDPATSGRVMQFKVVLQQSSRDDSFNPASGAALRGGRNQEPAIVRLADPNRGTIAPGVQRNNLRQLVLVEVEGDGGPIEVLLNNTKWDGTRDDTGVGIPGSTPDSFGIGNFLTELPRVGSTEVWEIANLSEDAHPIHVHLVQLQLINRQDLAVDPNDPEGGLLYRAHYDAQFPGGTFIPEFGPPRTYTDRNRDGAVGGNPSFSPWLTGSPTPPLASEAGWKDTLRMFPGTVTRIIARWAPQQTAVGGVQPGQNQFVFDPTQGPGYAWHCHILDHEDNEMMRPYIPSR